MEIIAYKGRPIIFFVDEFVSHFAPLQLYSNSVAYHFRNIEVESNDGSHLETLDALGPGRRIFKIMCIHSLIVKRLQNLVQHFLSPHFNKY